MMNINKIYYPLALAFIAVSILFSSCHSTLLTKTVKKPGTAINAVDDKSRQLHALFIDASKEKILGNYDKAAKLYQECFILDPRNAAVCYELSQVYQGLNRYQEAIAMAEKAASFDPENPWYLYVYAQLLEQSQQYNKASDIYKKLLEIEPDNVEFMDALAENQIFAGKYADAIRIYDRIEKVEGISEPVIIQKQKLYLELKKPDKAVAEVENLIRQYPGETRYYTLLAETWLAVNQKEKALEAYRRAEAIDPDDPYLQLSIGEMYTKTGDMDKSLDAMKKAFANPALELDMKVRILLTIYAVTEMKPEVKEIAYALLAVLREHFPDDPRVNSIYGDFLFRDKRLEEARDAFRKVIAVDSSRYPVWEGLLRISAELEDNEALAGEGTRAAELFPEQPGPFFYAGIANVTLKRYEEAIKLLKRGSMLVVDNDELLQNFYATLGDCYNQVKDNQSSDDYYEKALRIKYDYPYVLNNYSYYLALRGEKLEKAEAMARRANELEPDNDSYLDTHAWVLYKMNKLHEAEVLILKAIEKGGNKSAVILEHYGDILYKRGETIKALQYWEKARETGKGSDLLERKINEKKLLE